MSTTLFAAGRLGWRLCAFGMLSVLFTTVAQAQLEWHVSVKFILGAHGEMPCCGDYDSFGDMTNRINQANTMMQALGRGYTYCLTEVTTVSGISQWFDRDRDQAHALEVAAEADAATYKWRSDALNVYVNNWNGTAICSFPHDPSGENDILFFGQASFPSSFGHEAGHYFDLQHTFTGQSFSNVNNSSCDQGCMCAKKLPGGIDDDLIHDTLGDNECWNTQNDIAQGIYHVNYGAEGCDDAAVDRLYFNLMSYRTDVRDRMTEDQLDRMTDTSNGVRFNVTNGRTRFVATNGSDTSGNGSSTAQYQTLGKGLQVATPGDIVLLAAGNYNEPRFINQSVTLRATRGPVTIGR